MKNIIRIIALLSLSTVVFALGGKTFTWNSPTEREDSSPLPDNEIAAFNIYCDGDLVPIWTQTNEPNDLDQWIAPDNTFALGTHVCYATTLDTGGLESDPSNAINFTVTPAKPKPPVFAVQ